MYLPSPNSAGEPVSAAEKLESALYYLTECEFSIIPINSGEKRPHVKWKEYQHRRPTEEEVIQWWSQWPDADIGIVTGSISSIYVVDCDNEGALAEAKRLNFNSPIKVKTKRGYHIYFAHPQDDKWRGPQSGHGSKGEVWPKIEGLDFRGDGGYVVAPPSKGYSWSIDPGFEYPDDLPTFKDYKGAVVVDMSGKVVDINRLDLASITTDKLTIWDETAQRASMFPSGKIPRGGSGIHDTTFKYLSQVLLDVGVGQELEDAGRRFMETFFVEPLDEYRFQTSLNTVRTKERANHPERFDKETGQYITRKMREEREGISTGPVVSIKARKPLTVEDAERLIEESGFQSYIALPAIKRASIVQVYGYSGHGKSLFLSKLVYHAALGRSFGPFEITEKSRVLYLDYENGRGTLGAQMKGMRTAFGSAGDNYLVWTPFLGTEMNLRTPEGRREMAMWIREHKPDILVIDTIRSAFPGLAENSAEEWAGINTLALKLRNLGVTVILVHHANKPSEGGQGREAGSTNQLTTLETQIRVTQIYEDQAAAKETCGKWDGSYEGQSPWSGLRRKSPSGSTLQMVIEVSYGKVREWTDMHERRQFFGFGITATGGQFVVSSLSPKEKAKALLDEGRSIEAIVDTLKRPRQVVEQWLK